MNKVFAFIFAAAVLVVSCTPAQNSLTRAEKADGWELLFDGETLDGWHYYLGSAVDDGAWFVENGELTASGDGSESSGYIVTDKVYENFDLKWEWKISRGGNSGMIYHVQETPAFSVPFITGPEYQIIDDENFTEMNDGYVLEPWQKCAVDYAMYVPDFDTAPYLKPAGEWNSSEIIFDNGHVTYLLNGRVTVEFDAWTEDWFARKASGKWADCPEYGLSRRGSICIQDHGYPAWFRNIKVKKLPNKEVEEELFNGKDLKGWVNYGTELWYVDTDGCLVCESGPDKGYGYFATDKYYNDFDLSLEFMQEADGNSGVFIRSTVEGTTVRGWQVEVAPKGSDTGGIYESYGRGWLVQIPDEKEEILKEGEWNTLRILCQGDRVQTWLNGEPMVDLTDEAIGAGNGRIALQIHDGGGIKVRWRNLHVKTL